ncbi:MAG: glycosyltransferase [Clostridium sp.]
MKRCLHILPMNKLSGAEKMALLICRNMKEYEPIVACGGDELKSIFEKNGIKSYSIKFNSNRLLGVVPELKKIIKENEIHIVHAHDNRASLNAYLVKKIYGLNIKIISHIHSCYPWLKSENINKKIDYFLRSKYDYNIACGQIVYDFYNENTNNLLEGKSVVLSNAIDVDYIKSIDLSSSEKLRYKYKIPKEKIILGFIGRLCEIKGIIPFIKEFAKLKDDFSDCIVMLVGSGQQEDEIKTLIKDLGLEELFILTGFQDDVYKFYPIIDIFFLPSLYEGLPMVILEAMAFGKPVVSMAVGSIGEVVKERETGLLIEAGNETAFVESLKKIKNNKVLLNEYGDSAYEFIRDNYNIKSYIDKIENKYGDLFKSN